jgi:hypothetical protein
VVAPLEIIELQHVSVCKVRKRFLLVLGFELGLHHCWILCVCCAQEGDRSIALYPMMRKEPYVFRCDTTVSQAPLPLRRFNALTLCLAWF